MDQLRRKSLTHWGRPHELLQSQYGEVTYREWCEKERDRINKRGDGVRVVENAAGLIALSR